jgi:hypothetical protein
MAGLEVKAVANLSGTSLAYAPAVKAGPWIFLTGHEPFDFATGVTDEVAGPPGFPMFGRPRWRREGDYILQRMQRLLQELGSDLSLACASTSTIRRRRRSTPTTSRDARRSATHSAEHLGRHGALLWQREWHLGLAHRRGPQPGIRDP